MGARGCFSFFGLFVLLGGRGAVSSLNGVPSLVSFTVLSPMQVCLGMARGKMVCKQEVQEGANEITGADQTQAMETSIHQKAKFPVHQDTID